MRNLISSDTHGWRHFISLCLILLQFIIFYNSTLGVRRCEPFYIPDNDELLNIPVSVHPFRILNLRLTQFCALRQMCWETEGNELQNGRMMDSALFCFLL